MRRRHPASIEDLRQAIECLPPATRRAMLEGIRTNPIIVGGYTDGHGGVCPMLAAHRAGGRTNFIGFAKAWDRFAQVGGRARRATRRELLILESHLEASLLEEEGPTPGLAEALAEHHELLAQRNSRARRDAHNERNRRVEPEEWPAPDIDRQAELHRAPGWSWLTAFRRYDDYERALARVLAEQEAPSLEPVG